MTTLSLTPAEAHSAAAIQRVIDSLPASGGHILLPELDITLDRGIELRSGVTLEGRGHHTILRKGPGRDYPLSGYHNYGMRDVPLLSAEGLAVGMTVSVRDNKRLGFYETFARITWIDGDWVGLDHGLEADYLADCEPRLATAYPLIFGHGLHDVAIRNLTLDGRRADQQGDLGGCRGGAVYFAGCRDLLIADIDESDYQGEGLSFQMCRDVHIRNCRFNRNAGNGLHPGAGSTNCRFENCTAEHNAAAGFFFCVRANHVSVTGCRFADNGLGVSIGTRDCHNRLERCEIVDNAGAGILLRDYPAPTEVHSIAIHGCRIAHNGHAHGAAQIEGEPAAHHITITHNTIVARPSRPTPGIRLAPGIADCHIVDNHFDGCTPDILAPSNALVQYPPLFSAGHDPALADIEFRHLPEFR